MTYKLTGHERDMLNSFAQHQDKAGLCDYVERLVSKAIIGNFTGADPAVERGKLPPPPPPEPLGNK